MHKTDAEPQPIAVSSVDAAAMIGIGRTTMYELISRGEIPTVTIGRRRLVRVTDLVIYVDQLAVDEQGLGQR